MAGFNDGHFAGLANVIKDCEGNDAELRSAAHAVLLAGLMRLAGIIEAARQEGYRFTPTPPTAAELAYAAAAPTRFWRAALFVMEAAKALQRVAPGLRASLPAPAARGEEAAPMPAPGAPAPEKPAGPLEVRVIGMPARVSDALIERDALGNIVSSQRIEKDF